MSQEVRPISRLVCSCGGTLHWESRQTSELTRWLGLCCEPDCGQIVIPAVDGGDPPQGLEYVLLDGEPAPTYKPPWIRLFLQASRIARWTPADRCWHCHGALIFGMKLPMDRHRPADPFEVELCLSCGSIQLAFWSPPSLHRLRMTGAAWEAPAIPILALRRALRDRIADRELSARDD